MSSAKRTPRYVDVIRPFDSADGRPSSEILRLRPDAYGAPLPPITAAWSRPTAIPVERRPWQLLLVPPTPGAPTRSFEVARWQTRLLLSAAIVVLVVACAGVTALVVAVRAPNMFASSAEAGLLRERLRVIEDSLAIVRAGMEASDPPLASAIEGAGDLSRAVPTPSRPRFLPPAANEPSSRGSARASRTESSFASGGVEGLPVIGSIVSRFSHARRHPILRMVRPHLGVDVAARRGTKITAPAIGVVSYVGRRFGYGLVIEITHSNGVMTRYAHCGSALVSTGTRVERGVPIATVGTSGTATGPHLHYEVLVRGHHVDPLGFRMPRMGEAPVAPSAAIPATPSPTVPVTTMPATAASAVVP